MLRAADAMFHLILIDFLGARSRRSYNARLDTSPPQAWILVTSTSRSSWNWRLRPVWPPIYGLVPGFLISGAAMGTARCSTPVAQPSTSVLPARSASPHAYCYPVASDLLARSYRHREGRAAIRRYCGSTPPDLAHVLRRPESRRLVTSGGNQYRDIACTQ